MTALLQKAGGQIFCGSQHERDLIWFAVCLQTSFITPPVGFALFYMKGVAPKGVTTLTIYRGVIPFVIIQLIAVGLILEFPKIVTWLAKIAYG